MSSPFKIGLGDEVRDRISGLQGIVTTRAEHLFGCLRYWVTPCEYKDGKAFEGDWFDEDQLMIVEAAAVQPRAYRTVAVEQAPQELPKAAGPLSQPPSHVREQGR